MRIAVIGSRTITDIDISVYIPKSITELISGGARGIDTLAEKYADEHNIAKLIIKPDYKRFGRNAPLLRDKEMVDLADVVIAIWDGLSRGTKYTIDYAKKKGKTAYVYIIEKSD